ncbi:hypothetical protein D918_02184 [Trichuris suis]|nr:hypothetical protein D918_02184 [Trichuris suis]
MTFLRRLDLLRALALLTIPFPHFTNQLCKLAATFLGAVAFAVVFANCVNVNFILPICAFIAESTISFIYPALVYFCACDNSPRLVERTMAQACAVGFTINKHSITHTLVVLYLSIVGKIRSGSTGC